MVNSIHKQKQNRRDFSQFFYPFSGCLAQRLLSLFSPGERVRYGRIYVGFRNAASPIHGENSRVDTIMVKDYKIICLDKRRFGGIISLVNLGKVQAVNLHGST